MTPRKRSGIGSVDHGGGCGRGRTGSAVTHTKHAGIAGLGGITGLTAAPDGSRGNRAAYFRQTAPKTHVGSRLARIPAFQPENA
jgi:hypothetical protein